MSAVRRRCNAPGARVSLHAADTPACARTRARQVRRHGHARPFGVAGLQRLHDGQMLGPRLHRALRQALDVAGARAGARRRSSRPWTCCRNRRPPARAPRCPAVQVDSPGRAVRITSSSRALTAASLSPGIRPAAMAAAWPSSNWRICSSSSNSVTPKAWTTTEPLDRRLRCLRPAAGSARRAWACATRSVLRPGGALPALRPSRSGAPRCGRAGPGRCSDTLSAGPSQPAPFSTEGRSVQCSCSHWNPSGIPPEFQLTIARSQACGLGNTLAGKGGA